MDTDGGWVHAGTLTIVGLLLKRPTAFVLFSQSEGRSVAVLGIIARERRYFQLPKNQTPSSVDSSMGLTRVIPIKNVIISSENLSDLIREMAALVPEREKNLYRFNLTVYRNATTVETLDKRIKSYSSLFGDSLYRVGFEALDIGSGRRLECSIWHAGGDWANQITIKGDDSDWVEKAYRELTKIIGKFTPQNQFFGRWAFWFAGILAIPIGYLMLELLSLFVPPSSPPSPERTRQAAFTFWSIVVFCSAIFGIAPAMWLGFKVRSLFPSVELHCGSEHS